MKVVHLSTYDARWGAALGARRLHEALQAHPSCVSTMYVLHKLSGRGDVIPFAPPQDPVARIQRLLRRLQLRRANQRATRKAKRGQTHFSDDRTLWGRSVVRQLPRADVINLHWINTFLEPRRFFPLLSGSSPLVWTLRDKNPFTGGCHCLLGCQRYESACGYCPQIEPSHGNDDSRRIWLRKAAGYRPVMDRLHLVAPSRDMARSVVRSSLLGRCPVTYIPHGVDVNVFYPKPVHVARSVLQLPREIPIILFVASDSARHKGFDLLLSALRVLAEKGTNVLLLSVGADQRLSVALQHRHMGAIDREDQMATIYSAADVFVFPSREEAFGQTALEAMACGTPVVGFNVGALPDLVREGETGFLAPGEDIGALAAAICRAIGNPDMRARMGEACRKAATDDFCVSLQAQRYAALYEELLEERSRRSKTQFP